MSVSYDCPVIVAHDRVVRHQQQCRQCLKDIRSGHGVTCQTYSRLANEVEKAPCHCDDGDHA